MIIWYKSPDFELNDERKKALNEIARLVIELSETKPEKFISDETGRQMMKTTFGFANDINVGGVKKVEFGKDGEKVEKKVREIKISLDTKNIENKMNSGEFADKMFDSIDKLMNDATFQTYMKNDFYDWSMKLKPQIETLTEEKYPEKNENREEWAKNFDEEIKKFNDEKEENLKEFKEGFLEGVSENGDVKMSDMMEILEYTIYLEPGTNDYYGIKEKVKYKFPEKELNLIKQDSEELYNLLKDGFIYEFEVYDINFNEKVSPVEIPTDAKSFEELDELMRGDEDVQNFAMFVNSILMPKAGVMGNGANSESAIYPDYNTGQLVYYDAETGMSYQIVKSDPNTGKLFFLNSQNQLEEVPMEVIQRTLQMMQEQQETMNGENVEISDEEQAEIEKMEQ